MTTGASTQAGLVMAATVPGLPTPPPSKSGAGSASSFAGAATAPNPEEEAKFDSLVGAVLADRYQIVRRIGEGGMGAVYEAKHTVIGKRVAVKVLLEKFLAKSDFVARLLQEARLVTVDIRFTDYDGPVQFGDDSKELEDLVSAFRTFLVKKIEAPRKAHPGKTVRLSLKAG